MIQPKRKQAFEGIKVVDFGWVAVAPVAAKYLGDFGATVVRVECHRRFSIMKQSGPNRDDEAGINRSIWWANWNSSKLSMTVDLAMPKGREVGLRLIKWADVAIQGYPTRVMKDFGLDYEEVRKVNPDIIYAQTTQYGSYGPSSEFTGYGFMSASIAGFTDITGWPDREAPCPPFGAYTDFISYRFLVASIMAALDHRRRTGKGQLIDQAQVETALHFLAPPIMDYAINDRVIARNGNRHPYAAPHGVYPCRGEERWVAIAVFTDEEWLAFCTVIGEPQWTKEAKLATLRGRKENEDELDGLVSEWTQQYTAEEVTCLMQSARVAASV